MIIEALIALRLLLMFFLFEQWGFKKMNANRDKVRVYY
jgi:hypothetical protein